MMNRRFSLLALLVAVSVLGVLFASVERHTQERLSQTWHCTQMVAADESEVRERAAIWLDGHGFQLIANPPPALLASPDAHPSASYYLGSFKGSQEFYLSFHPNWDPVDRRAYEKCSNVSLLLVAECAIRSWEIPDETVRLRAFVEEFKRWGKSFGPLRRARSERNVIQNQPLGVRPRFPP